MDRRFGSRVGRARGALLVAILTATLVPASSVALATDASPEPGASPVEASPVAETVHGWPGARAERAGLYSWRVGPGLSRWMHKVPEGWSSTAPNSVELAFLAAEEADAPEMMWSPAVFRSWWAEGRFDEHPARVLDVRTEMWLLDVQGTRVAILLDSYPDTDPALLAEARAVIDSIVVLPTASGPRLVFRLLEGWDSG
jgi:hypothetical protein